ncbi:TPA: NAD-dependent epimerase/dehydratase family protein [Candidatus Micrarchaeota archaeon]|nr:NAD-dependent epimerase/dehydratase family protein [Candidatus Micrarchaeota archaeon]
MAKFMVTGGAGFIGSHITEHLAALGNEVLVYDDFSTGLMSNLDHIANKGKMKVVRGSVTSFDSLRDTFDMFGGCDYIFHEAAQVSVASSLKNPQKTYEINVGGTLNVLKAAKEVGAKRVVLASSAAVYGNLAKPVGAGISEDDPTSSISPYASSKLRNEQDAFDSGVETVCLRYFNVFGPRQSPDSPYSGVISKFANEISSGKSPTIFGDGTQTRDFVYVGDVAHANLLAFESKNAAGHVFNIGSGTTTTINGLVAELNSILGTNVTPDYASERVGDIKHSCADISKARKSLGFFPTYQFKDGLRMTIDWLKKRKV